MDTQEQDVSSETVEQEQTNNTEEVKESKTYSQADLDAAITKAISTREKNLKKQWEDDQKRKQQESEQKRLQDEQKYKELWEQAQAEKQQAELERNTLNLLKQKDAVELSELFNLDMSTLEGRQQVVEFISDLITNKSTAQVAEKLSTPAPVKGKPPVAKTIKDMSPEEWNEYKKTLGIVA